ncbi:ISL3 family transposase, partial [Candidatus Margulisiibacteriota bacterium]
MPLSDSILNLKEYEIEEVEGNNPVRIYARYIGIVNCPYCADGNIRLKDTFVRKLRHESIGNRKTVLHLQSHKYRCQSCNRYFNQRFPGILKYRRSTEGFRREVFEKHREGISQSSLSKNLAIGSATVERWYHDFLARKVAEMKSRDCPRVLGIDEHFFSRKQGYATTLCDLYRHKVFDVVLGRSEASLESYLNKLHGKENVQVVVMDLSETYRGIINRHFPNAKIVSDRFHVIRLIGQHFLKTWQEIDPEGRKNRGLLSLMRRHKENMSPEQWIKLKSYFNEHPELKPIYDFKQQLCRLMLMKKKTAKQCKRLIPQFLRYIKDLQESMLDPMVKLGNTLERWAEEIVCMWRFTKSNGITEGFHTKMEMI